MKNYISVHYENFKSKDEIKHNMRKQKEPEHLLKKEYRMQNVIDEKTEMKYIEALEEAKRRSPKSFQKKSKPNVDMVMSWSWDKVKENINKYGIEKYNKLIMERVEEFGKRIEKEYGLKYISANLHNDEGKVIDNEVRLNQHCHITFLDFDFKKNRRVLRTLHRTDLKKWQQIAEDCFNDLGFIQGKNEDKKKHIEAKEYGKLKERLSEDIDKFENEIDNMTLEELQEMKLKYKDDKLKKRLVDYVYRFKKAEQEAKDTKKTYERIVNTWNKIQQDGEITKEEQVEFTKMLKALGAKQKAKSVSKMKISNAQK